MNRFFSLTFLLIGFACLDFNSHWSQAQVNDQSAEGAIGEESGEDHAGEAGEPDDAHAGESGHDNSMTPLLFIIIALVIGAATRHFLRNFPLPYTVILLMIGLGMGALSRFGLLEGGLESIGMAINWAGHIGLEK